MRDDGPDTMRLMLTAEATRRFGAERAAALARDLDALARELARVAAADVPDSAEPAFFLGADARA
jgi:hypothetical protein